MDDDLTPEKFSIGGLTDPPFLISDLIAATANAIVAGGAYVHGLTVVVPGATTPSIKIFDGLTATGTAKFQMLTPTVGFFPLGFTVVTGITVQIAGTTPPQCYLHYKKA